jgi:hypothetical protein
MSGVTLSFEELVLSRLAPFAERRWFGVVLPLEGFIRCRQPAGGAT